MPPHTPDFPRVADLRDIALSWVVRRASYNTDDLKAFLAPHFDSDVLSIKLTDGRSKFLNLVDWLTARWTSEGIHTGADKFYQLADYGRELALDLVSKIAAETAFAERSVINSVTQKHIDSDLAIPGVDGGASR